MSNMNLIWKRNYNYNFIFRTLLSIYREKKSSSRHWKIVSAPTSQLWPGIFQSSKMSNNLLSHLISLLLTCWLTSRCETEWISQVYDFFTSDVIGQNFLLITSSQVGYKFAQKEHKKSCCNILKIISVVLQCCWLCCQPPHLAGTHTVLKCLW